MTATSARAPRWRNLGQAARLLHSEADGRVLSHGVATVAAVIAAGSIAALTPLALKSLIDAVAAPPPPAGTTNRWATALPCGLAYLLLLLAGRVLADLRPLLSGAIQHRLRGRLARRFFGHVLRLPLAVLLRRKGGELQHCLDLATAGAQLLVNHLVGSLLPVMVEIATMTIVLIHLHEPALVTVFGVAALTYLALFTIGARCMGRTAHAVSQAALETYARLGDGLAHLETLRHFAAEEQACARLDEASAVLERHWTTLDRLNAAIALAASAIFAVSMAACLIIGADAVARHTMTLGGFVLTAVYALQMVRPLESLGSAARDLARALGCLRPLLELLAEPLHDEVPGAVRDTPIAAPKRADAPTVRIENLHFSYDPGQPVLKGIDLDVPAGTTTAIVGRSGSGKSSLARLLMRLYMPQQGRILLDGRAIASIDAAELRGTLVGLVPQETALLHDTIAGNIALGAPTATRDEIRAAARCAQLEAVIDALPRGLDTPVGERGMKLSGGERQRVGIARALLRRPGLYVLDEPTSMLDSRTEQEIQQAMRSHAAGSTRIVIAHRLSTVVDADQIVVLDDGQVRERGRHGDLLALHGLYARMWQQQMAHAP